jgi:hypothetical protein
MAGAGGTSVAGTRRFAVTAVVGIVVGGLLVGWLLSACTGDDADKPPPSASATSPAATPSTPAATAPTAPEAKPTSASAEAFVRYFWDVYNYSYQALDVTDLNAVSSDSCKFCKSTTSEITALKNARKHIQGGNIRIATLAVPPGDPTNGVIVTLVINQEPGKTLNADGTISSVIRAAKNMRSEVALRWQGSRWSVYGVANQEKSGQS